MGTGQSNTTTETPGQDTIRFQHRTRRRCGRFGACLTNQAQSTVWVEVLITSGWQIAISLVPMDPALFGS